MVPVAVIAALASIVATETAKRPPGVPLKVGVVSFPNGIVTNVRCLFSSTEDAVTASGRIVEKLGWDSLSLAVYDANSTLLNARGVMDSTSVNVKYTPRHTWQITAKIVGGGYHPVRCLLDVGTPSPGKVTHTS
jgi:hypothetical protein